MDLNTEFELFIILLVIMFTDNTILRYWWPMNSQSSKILIKFNLNVRRNTEAYPVLHNVRSEDSGKQEACC